MNFIDNTGHIFSLTSWKSKPIGHEYDENPYVFWLDTDKTSRLAVGNYYMRSIYLVVPFDAWIEGGQLDDMLNVEITIDSQVFSFVNPVTFQDTINGNCNIKNVVNISDAEFTNRLTNAELFGVVTEETDDMKAVHKVAIIPFYVVGYTEEEGTWTTNILIHVSSVDGDDVFVNEDWCSISVGGTWQDEHEELVINGRNIGINLPIDILKAVYQQSYLDEGFDVQLYNEKLKEYLLNHMVIKGEQGNFRSAINALDWFGYNGRVTLSSLLQTDNQFKMQYVRDYFDIETDLIESYNTFRNSTLLSLSIPTNNETGETYGVDFNKDFFGEDTPVLETLMDKIVPVEVGRSETTVYWKPYYDFTFYDLAFKLSALKYYYEKYFLPVHLSLNSASLTHKVYTNDIKFISKATETITEQAVNIEDDDYDVYFPAQHTLWLTSQLHWVDDAFNEYQAMDNTQDWYYIYDTCTNIPIRFKQYDKLYRCVLILEKEYPDNPNFVWRVLTVSGKHPYNAEITCKDKNGEIYGISRRRCSWSTDGKTFSFWFDSLADAQQNIIDTFTKEVTAVKDTFTDDDSEEHAYYYVEMFGKRYVVTEKSQNIPITFNGNPYTLFIPPISQLGIDVIGGGNAICNVSSIPLVHYRFQYDQSEISSLKVNGQEMVGKVNINYTPSSNIIYESRFEFVQHKDDYATQYRDFVIYPKMISDPAVNKEFNKLNEALYSKNHIDYWVNSNFKLRLLVNNRWYEYKFDIRIPDLDIRFGTLQYKYWKSGENYTTHFDQLNSISEDRLVFNSFMYAPELVNVNHIDFFADFVKYLKLTDVRYVNWDFIPDGEYYKYIEIGEGESKQRIYIPMNRYKDYIDIPFDYLNQSNIYLLFYDDVKFILVENPSDEIPSDSVLTVHEIVNNGSLNDNLIGNEEETSAFVYEDGYVNEEDYVRFYYDEATDSYWTDVNGKIYSYPVYESLHGNIATMLSRYKETAVLPNTDEYLNQIHIYDLYRRERKIDDRMWILHNNIDLRCRNIRFTHGYFFDDTLYVQGKPLESYNYGIDKNHVDLGEDGSIYTSLNTRDDLTRYSIYWNDYLRKEDNSMQPSGFVYYNEVDEDGNLTGNQTTEAVHVISSIKPLFYQDFYGFNEFENLDRLIDVFAQHGYSLTITPNDMRVDIPDTVNQLDYSIVKYQYSVLKVNNSGEYDVYKPRETEIRSVEEALATNDGVTLTPYKIRIRFYYVTYTTRQNIEREWDGEGYPIYEETPQGLPTDNLIGWGGTREDGTPIRLVPYWSVQFSDDELIGKEDKDVGNKVLNTQTSAHWYDVDSNSFNTEEDDTINQYWLTIDDLLGGVLDEIPNDYDANNDTKSDLFYRNFLTKDLTDTFEAGKYYTLDYTAKATVYDSEYNTLATDIDWDGFKIVVSIKYKDEEQCEVHTLCDEVFIIRDGVEKITAFFLIESYPEYNGQVCEYFTASVTPKVCNVSDVYEKLPYGSKYTEEKDHISVRFEGKNYVYGRNTSQPVIDLYNEFFHNETWNYKLSTVKDGIISNTDMSFTNVVPYIKLEGQVDYDFYLMHDNDYWYVVFISKQTCDKALNPNNLTAKTPKIVFNGDDKYIDNNRRNDDGTLNENYYPSPLNGSDPKYELRLNRSGKQFLVNRYEFIPTNGINQFGRDDLIVAKLENNDRLPVNVWLGAKWHVTPTTLGVDKSAETESNAEMVLLNVPEDDGRHARGYYNVEVRYSLDIHTQQRWSRNAKIKIS